MYCTISTIREEKNNKKDNTFVCAWIQNKKKTVIQIYVNQQQKV